MAKDPRFPPDTPLLHCGERRVGLDLPPPIDARIDALRQEVEAAGERTNRKELVAALLLAAPSDAEELARLLKRYRLARVRDAALVPDEHADVIAFPRQRPGPRRKHG
jgi:hypothetical protein